MMQGDFHFANGSTTKKH